MHGASILTEREHEIMIWLADGWKNREIAMKLGISENTVERHLKNIYAKLKVRNRVEAARRIWGKSRDSVVV